MLTEIAPSTSHFYRQEITSIQNNSPAVKLIDEKQNLAFVGGLQGAKGIKAFHRHYRLLSLQLEFWHDGYSLPRAGLPPIDSLQPDYEQQEILSQWISDSPKRLVEIYLSGLTLNEPIAFVYTQANLVGEIDFLAVLGVNNLIIDPTLSLKVVNGLQGKEKIRVYAAWNEYFTVVSA